MNTTQHSITLAAGVIPYTLKVSAKRRTLGLRIDDRGLTVYMPKRVSQRAMETFLRAKADWIAHNLTSWENRPAAAKVDLQDGGSLKYLGQTIQLNLRQDTKNRAVEFDGARLYMALPDPTDTATVQRKISQWYTKQARADFTRRIEILAAKLGVTTPPLFLSSAKTRWGSCNSKGEIRLHWRLIQAPPHIIHYVAAHELAHLKEMNHSAKFWAWVEKLCPEYDAARKELKALSPQLHLV